MQNWYHPYTTADEIDPQGPSSGINRVMRGGSWLHDAGLCRSAFRVYGAPFYRDRDLGFRIVREVA